MPSSSLSTVPSVPKIKIHKQEIWELLVCSIPFSNLCYDRPLSYNLRSLACLNRAKASCLLKTASCLPSVAGGYVSRE